MRRHAVVIGLSFLGLSAAAFLAGWAFHMGSRLDLGLEPIWRFVLGAVATSGALLAFLLWLAAYSTRHGANDPRYRADDRWNRSKSSPGRTSKRPTSRG